MSGSPSVPALINLLSETLLPKASISSQEQQRYTRTLTQLAYSTLLGLNQAVISDVEEHERENAIDHKLRLIQQDQHDSNLEELLGNFYRQHLFPSPHEYQKPADTTARQLMNLTENQAVVSMLLDLQGSVPKPSPAPSGFFIPEPLQIDFARDFLPQPANSSGPAGDMQALQAPMPNAWQPQFTWQGKVEMPASYVNGTEDTARACQVASQHAHPHALRDPFRLIHNAAFEQMPNAALLTDGSDSQTRQLQHQQQGYVLPEASACSSQEDVELQGQSSWQKQVNRFESMRESMHQRPTWKASEVKGADASIAPLAGGGVPLGLPLSLLQMNEAPGSFSALTGPSLFANSSEVGALQPLGPSSAGRQQQVPAVNSSAPPRLGQSVNRGAESLRSSDEFPSNKENNHMQHTPHTSLQARASKPYMHATGRALEGVEVVADHIMAREAVYALQGVQTSIERLETGKLCTPEQLPASLGRLVSSVVKSGQRRRLLEAFVTASGTDDRRQPTAHDSSQADPTLQAFAAAVLQQLRDQAAALQQLPAAVQARRHAELGAVLSKAPLAGRHADMMTVLEVVLHTHKLQAQLKTLASICWCEPFTAEDTSSLALATSLPRAQQHQPDTTTSHMACRWTLEGFPRGPALLTHLHSQLMEADDQAAPLLQHLLQSAIVPYMCHMRSWLFTNALVMPGFDDADSSEAGSWQAALDRLDSHRHIQVLPGDPPQFLHHVQRQLVLAGWQLRVLDKLKPACGCFLKQMKSIAAAEAREAALVTSSHPDHQASPHINWSPATATEQSLESGFPLVFTSKDLQKVQAVQAKASRERMLEADSMLAHLAQQRLVAAAAADEEIVIRKQTLHNAREAARARKAEEVRQQRLHRAQLLKEQLAAMTAQQARQQAAAAIHLRQEQEVLQAAAEQEHSQALTAAKASVASGQQELQHMQRQVQRMAWRNQRWQLAAHRRTTLQAIMVAEDSDLAVLASDPLMRQPPTAKPADAAAAAAAASNNIQIMASSLHGDDSSHALTDDAQPRDQAMPSTRSSDALHAGAAAVVDVDDGVVQHTGPLWQTRSTWGTMQQPSRPAGRGSAQVDTAASLLHGNADTDQPAVLAEGTNHQGGAADQTSTPGSQTEAVTTATLPPATAAEQALVLAPSTLPAQPDLTTAAPAVAGPPPDPADSDAVDALAVSSQSAKSAGPKGHQWGPVQNPFPAAGQVTASSSPADNPQGPVQQAPSSKAHAAFDPATASDADTAPATVGQPAEPLATATAASSPKLDAKSRHSSAAGASAHRALTEHVQPDGTISSAVSSSVDRQAAGSQNPRREWGRVVHPFAAAGVASGPIATASATSISSAPSTHGAAAHQLRTHSTSQVASVHYGGQAHVSTPVTRLSHPRRTWGLHTPSPHSNNDAEDAVPSASELFTEASKEEDMVLPLSVVVDTCLVQGIKDQYSCVSKACVGLIRDELKLNTLLHTLRQFFFMGAGDWADGLISDLTSNALQHSRLYQHSVQSILDASFKGTSEEHNVGASKLTITMQQPTAASAVGHRHRSQPKLSPRQSSSSRATAGSPFGRDGKQQQIPRSSSGAAGVQIDADQLRAFDAVQLTYDVPWPLCLVITQEGVQHYSQIFSWLLSIKRVSLAMQQLWSDFVHTGTSSTEKAHAQVMTAHQSGATAHDIQHSSAVDSTSDRQRKDSSLEPLEAQSKQQEVRQRVKVLQLFRHEAAHFAAALQSYMQAQLLGQCWQQLQDDIQNRAADLLELSEAHSRYLTTARRVCLLSDGAKEMHMMVESVLQSALDFVSMVRRHGSGQHSMQAFVSNDDIWSRVSQQRQDFSNRFTVVYKLLKYANGRGRYQELFVLLDMNEHYASEA